LPDLELDGGVIRIPGQQGIHCHRAFGCLFTVAYAGRGKSRSGCNRLKAEPSKAQQRTESYMPPLPSRATLRLLDDFPSVRLLRCPSRLEITYTFLIRFCQIICRMGKSQSSDSMRFAVRLAVTYPVAGAGRHRPKGLAVSSQVAMYRERHYNGAVLPASPVWHRFRKSG
jgi:hypothetical protein